MTDSRRQTINKDKTHGNDKKIKKKVIKNLMMEEEQLGNEVMGRKRNCGRG